jgi:HK97 family phage major capsid protein
MADMTEVMNLIQNQDQAWKSFHENTDRRIGAIESTIDDLSKKAGRPGVARGAAPDTERLSAAIRAFATKGDDRELKGMTTTSDPSGGYLVVPEWDRAVRLIRDRVSPLSSLCREVVLTEGTEFKLPYTRSVLTGTWVSETDSRGVTADPEFGEHSIPLREVYVSPQISQMLLDQAHYPIDSVLTDLIAHGLAVTEATALHVGNGVGQPRGVLTYATAATADATRALGTVEHVATGVSGAFAAVNPVDVLMQTLGRLAPQYRQRAVWVMPRTVAATLQTFKDGAGGFLWQRGLALGQPDSLLGFPVAIDDSMPDASANSLSIMFGDLQAAYCIVRTPGLRLLRDPYTVKGSVAFYAFSRIGGAVIDDRAIKFVKFGTA